MNINYYIGLIFISGGILFIGIGIYGIYKYKNFYTRASLSSIIDTAGFILVVAGIMIYKGLSFFSLKTSLIILLMLLLNPLTNHIIVQSAYRSGYSIKEEK